MSKSQRQYSENIKNMEENTKEIKDHIDRLVIAARSHTAPSEETRELFAKLDKSLALLTQEVSYIRTTIDHAFGRYDKRIDDIASRLESLEYWKVKLAGIILAITVIFGVLYDYIKSKIF